MPLVIPFVERGIRIETLVALQADQLGAEDFGEVVELFLEEVDELVERLSTAPDPSAYEADLHFLKGSALNLGFAEFAALCADGEQKSAQGEQAAVNLQPVLDCYHASRAQFLASAQADSAA